MSGILASRLADLVRVAYGRAPVSRSGWRPRHVDAFSTPSFAGLAGSDDDAAYLVFRGTKLALHADDLFRRALQAWLANLDFAQVAESDGLVHRGYARELDRVGAPLAEMIRDHAAGGRPIYVTGHSAGGALATLAARRLHEAGAAIRAAVVFAAPRVGDRRYAATYPVPLLRIEHRHDLIPHLPLPPALARSLGAAVIDPLLDTLGWRSRLAAGTRLGRTDYVHVGELLYHDGASVLYRVPPGQYLRRFGAILREELAADLLGRGSPPDPTRYRHAACPSWATPVPARLMDGLRLTATLAQIGWQLRTGRVDFLLDHHLDRSAAALDLIRGGHG